MLTTRVFESKKQSFALGSHTMTFETGKYAQKADGAVTVSLDDNVMLATAVMDMDPKPDLDFFPLTVDWRESFSATGRIGGSPYRRREGRPSDTTILYARLTDRSLRPLFPKTMINPTVVSLTPLALDHTQDLAVMSIVASSMAVMISGIAFDGPVGAARVAYIDDQYVINPSKQQLDHATLNLLVAGPQGLINMIEMDANEVSEDILLHAFELGQVEIDRVCQQQVDFASQHDITTLPYVSKYPDEHLIDEIKKIITDQDLEDLLASDDFGGSMRALEKKADEVLDREIHDHRYKDVTFSLVKQAVFHIIKYYIRHRTLDTGVRVDGRDIHTIRPLFTEVGTLPRVHGSGLFWRGDTQVLTTCTLGSPGDAQTVDDMEHVEDKMPYMHHYNFPPFSTGEARGTRGAGRREIGHGKLAEKALEIMLPTKEEFPYTIRLVSDCLGSGGSTSMAATCASTLALMDAGVPLRKPVSGIAMGLMTRHDTDGTIADYAVLTDLKGTEDFIGDMDFKITGTRDGMTAIQLDVKIKGLTMEIVRETVTRATQARLDILDFMAQTIETPRPSVSEFAPKIEVFSIDPDKIKLVIGKGGETIDKIIEEAGGVKIDFEDDGTVFIADTDAAKIAKAKELILDIAEDLPLNVVLDGTIASVQKYGLFVDLPRKKSGLVHISKLGPVLGSLESHYKVGQTIKVKVTAVDDKDRLVLEKG